MPNNNDWDRTRAQQPLYGNYGYYPETNYPYSPYGNYRVPANYTNNQPLPAFQPQQPPISGRWVTDANEITPQEVPMNGSIAFFPLKDYSKILAKAWDQNGTIKTVEYVQVIDANPSEKELQSDTLEKRLERMEGMLRSMQQKIGKLNNKQGGENNG